MREFQARKKQSTTLNRWLSSPWVLLGLLVVFILLVKGTWRVYGNYSAARRELHQVEADATTAQNRQAELDKTMQKIGSEEGNDYEIRKNLDVSKPDEHVLHIIDTSENATSNRAR